jgi:3-methylfumaryl-CoA hydratase
MRNGRARPAADVATFEFRAVRPIFDVAPCAVCGQPAAGGGTVRLCAQYAVASLAMDATATLR